MSVCQDLFCNNIISNSLGDFTKNIFYSLLKNFSSLFKDKLYKFSDSKNKEHSSNLDLYPETVIQEWEKLFQKNWKIDTRRVSMEKSFGKVAGICHGTLSL